MVVTARVDCSRCGAPRETAHALCRPCRNAYMRDWYRRNPEKVRQKSLNRRRGRDRLTQADYEALLNAQGGVCAVCGGGPENQRHKLLHVDHDHATGRIRGLLCSGCNTGLGLFHDDPVRLRSAIAYLTGETP